MTYPDATVTQRKPVIGDKVVATVCIELAIVLPFEMVIVKMGTMSETTRSQLPSSKQRWRVKTAIKQQEVDKGWELHDNLTSLLLYSD